MEYTITFSIHSLNFFHSNTLLAPYSIERKKEGRGLSASQRTPEQYSANRTAGPVSQTCQTGCGGPVSTGLTGSGALVAYQSSSEPITSIPTVQVDFSRTNGLLVIVFLHTQL
jgi:hypothetical protein